jgi:hypothetical protein
MSMHFALVILPSSLAFPVMSRSGCMAGGLAIVSALWLAPARSFSIQRKKRAAWPNPGPLKPIALSTGSNDEISLSLAVGSIEGLVLMHLGEIGLKVIEHDNASASVKKIKRWDRRRHWLWNKMPDWITGNWIEPEEDTGLRFPPAAGGAA